MPRTKLVDASQRQNAETIFIILILLESASLQSITNRKLPQEIHEEVEMSPKGSKKDWEDFSRRDEENNFFDSLSSHGIKIYLILLL